MGLENFWRGHGVRQAWRKDSKSSRSELLANGRSFDRQGRRAMCYQIDFGGDTEDSWDRKHAVGTTFLKRIILFTYFHSDPSLFPVRAVHPTNRREDLIQDSVRKLLGVQSTPREGKRTPLPPSYVMDLYEKYRSGRTPMQGNTVRSILPMRDTIGEADVLIFNLTGIHPTEQILQSKLYLLKRRRPKPGKRRDSNTHFKMKIGSLPLMTSHRYVEVSLTRHRSEWHSYDITESVVHCRQNTNKDQLLGVTLEVRRARGGYRLSPFRRLLKQDSQPFVLIFSEDSSNQTRGTSLRGSDPHGEIQGLLRAKTGDGPSPLQKDSSSERGLLLERRRRSLNGTGDVKSPLKFYSDQNGSVNVVSDFDSFLMDNENFFGVGVPNSRWEKLRLLNELINSFSNNPDEFGISPESSPSERRQNSNSTSSRDNPVKVLEHGLLKWSENSSKSDLVRLKRSVSGTSPTSKELTDNVSETFQNSLGDHKPTNSSTREWSGSKKRKKNQNRKGSERRKKKKKRGRKKKNPKLPSWWSRHDNRLHKQDYGRQCHRRSMVVDFAQLGWGNWVVSPKTFNAYYCSGGCSFPMIKNANPSNHAAIQSLMQAIGQVPELPSPSCVPTFYSPLTLLYFDENGNFLIKEFPNMIAEKCACR